MMNKGIYIPYPTTELIQSQGKQMPKFQITLYENFSLLKNVTHGSVFVVHYFLFCRNYR
ncbi:unnamed protein product [Brugia timori]|uniref:Uncharacterized protein n=1 Tax=Brugia timori TaxID=42155 RepID=A0A0R3QHB6_9BILA|nr:unnamed protein product [Brugia timori]